MHCSGKVKKNKKRHIIIKGLMYIVISLIHLCWRKVFIYIKNIFVLRIVYKYSCVWQLFVSIHLYRILCSLFISRNQYLYYLRDSSPKNENYVINYSPSCHSKHVRPSFVKLWLNTWCHMDYFTDDLATFLDLGTLQLCCCLCRVRKISDFIKNILICVPKMNEVTGLERHDGE